ncbi:MAG: hypothetical protein KIT02_17050 [Devosia sp.]|uniref:hypothetical protein n=1 Tax=Devosia sp. TaxID=1871048 RepID=UPI0024C50D83|nr:hypothetical protein [Devosia sp.]UYN99587.1 MAG: hypothetical protein KIT02_17050 [Devosia sp.]
MFLPDRKTLTGMVLGALSATALATIGPGYVLDVFADEMPLGFDTDNLVRFEGNQHEVSYADWVSTDPVSTATVTKIEGGRVTQVIITTTATGTYSTDGLTSQHVLYPGIDVTRRDRPRNSFASWSGGQWKPFAPRPANSYYDLP